MSANNIVVVRQYSESPFYRVSDQCVECEFDENHFDFADTLEDAVRIAQKYTQEELVEYGITFQLLK